MPGITIDRCLCRGLAFADLLPVARAEGWNVDDLARETGAGGRCGLCRPYLRRMLVTGETELHSILTDDAG
jgi:bacterioferritin-associated ferredoxin